VPLYDYAPRSGKCNRCKGRFEAFQPMAEAPLKACPSCGKPCERVVTAAAITGKYSTSDSRVKELGMTKYKKAGDGVYEKTAGRGPDVIRKKR
jgi:putative FmdB family regulatory protein